MKLIPLVASLATLLAAGCAAPPAGDASTTAGGLQAIRTVVVIYAENRAFDTLYGLYPGANGIPGVNPTSDNISNPQRDFDGRVLPVMPAGLGRRDRGWRAP